SRSRSRRLKSRCHRGQDRVEAIEPGSQFPRPGGSCGLEFYSGEGSARLEDLEHDGFDRLGDLRQQVAKRTTEMGFEWNAVELGQAVVDPDEAKVTIEKGQPDGG